MNNNISIHKKVMNLISNNLSHTKSMVKKFKHRFYINKLERELEKTTESLILRAILARLVQIWVS